MAYKTFTQFVNTPTLAEVAVGKEATEFEELIADALTQLSKNPAISQDQFKFTPKSPASKFPGKAKVAWKIASTVLQNNPSEFASTTFSRAGGTRPTVSTDYLNFGGTDQTSKADIVSDDGRVRFSVKEMGGAFLGTPQSGALKASFEFALAAYPGKFQGTAKVRQIIEQAFQSNLDAKAAPEDIAKWVDIKHSTTQNIRGKRASSAEKDAIVQATDPTDAAQPKLGWLDAAELIMAGELTGKKDTQFSKTKFPAPVREFLSGMFLHDMAIKGELDEAFNEAFSQDETMRKLFVFQEASGLGKFGGCGGCSRKKKNQPQPSLSAPILDAQGPAGSANYFLTFNKTTGAAKVEAITTDAAFITALSNRVSFRFRWRGTLGVVRMALDIAKGTPAQQESRVVELSSRDWLHEEWATWRQSMLQEGIRDTLAGWWNRLKAWLQSLQQKFLTLFDQAAAQGPDELLDFLGLELDAVEVVLA